MLTFQSRRSNHPRADQARLLPHPPPYRRLRRKSPNHTPVRCAILQKFHKAELGRRGWQLQTARERGCGNQEGTHRPHGIRTRKPTSAIG